jgi:hypothetical protein
MCSGVLSLIKTFHAYIVLLLIIIETNMSFHFYEENVWLCVNEWNKDLYWKHMLKFWGKKRNRSEVVMA